ncbi:MFS transporter [Prosthecobacter sp. SYSU 5D2]|uniref:MFS transporter n=1 Tax=Prosthecobacter sp. SYSU 5D2 TaxID=3134134 RepID=UPI0031FEE253
METDPPSPGDAASVPPPVAARRAVTLLFFINGALFASWVSRIPALQQKLDLSHGTLGLALLGMATGALVSMPLAGWCSTRYGSHRVCQLSAALYALALPLLAFAPGTAAFMIALVFFGAAHGALDVAMNAQAVQVEKQYPRPIMAAFHAWFSLGGLAGAALGGSLATWGLSPVGHYLLAAGLLGGVGAVFALPRLFQDTEPSNPTLSSLASTSTRAPLDWGPEKRRLLLLGTVAFCVMIGEGAMADWSAVFLLQVTGAAEGIAAAGYAAFSIAMAVCRFCGDRLAQHLGPVHLVRLSGLLATVGLALALLDGRPVSALIGFAAVGAGFATVVPQVFSAAGNVPGVASGPALATVTTMGYLGFLIGPPFIGLVAEAVGLRLSLGTILLTSMMLILLAPALRLPSGRRRRSSATKNKSIFVPI